MSSYTIKSGDTLSRIAARYNTTVSALAQANGIRDPNRIIAGKSLSIPGGSKASSGSASGGGYTVKSGDTLSGIAARYGTTVGALAKANGIQNPNMIRAGANLRIPGGDHFQDSPSRPGSTPSSPGSAPTQGTDGVTAPPPGDVKGGVSLQQLKGVMPNLSDAKAREYLPHLNRAMSEANINTPRRQAAFLAQLAHESGEFRYMEEIASGAAYEGRRDLGNTQAGDGVRFKGRGPIQLTGRANYTAASRALGIDLVSNPSRAAQPDVAFRTAAWFWNSRNLNSHADAGNFDAVTYRVNGGYNGKASRDMYYRRALDVLG